VSLDLGTGAFGYRVTHLIDGRVELVDPDHHWKRGSWGFHPNWTPMSDLLGWLAFSPLLAVPIVFVVVGASFVAAGNVRGLVAIAVGLLVATVIINSFYLRRAWRLAPGTIVRHFKVKGLPIGAERHFAGIDRLEILHAVWHDDNGWTDSVVGWANGRAFSLASLDRELAPMKAGQFADLTLEEAISRRIWWLGHEMAARSGLPLAITAGARDAPVRGD
jgi:hypothetical protein